MNSINLFFLTEECNMNCDYCYERKIRENKKVLKTATTVEIDEFISDVIKREGKNNTSLRLFGGEPLLYPHKTRYFVEELLKRKPNTGLNILTNGTRLLHDETFEIVQDIYEITKNKMSLKFEISWDGHGHTRRVYTNGEQTRFDVEKGMERLVKHNLPFAVSYAVHRTNKDYVLKDYIYLAEKFGPEVIKNIDLTYVQIEVEEKEHKDMIRPFAERLYNIYGIPLCSNLVCNQCGKCQRTQEQLVIGTPGKKLFNRNLYQNREWDYFDEGVIE